MKLIVLFILLQLSFLQNFAIGKTIYTVQELKMDSIINEILLKLKDDKHFILKNNLEDIVSIKFIKPYYVSLNSVSLKPYSNPYGDPIFKLYPLDSVLVPLINNEPLYFKEYMGHEDLTKYTLSVYNNQITFFEDNQCVSVDDFVFFPDDHLFMLKGKKRVIISEDFKRYIILGFKDPMKTESQFVFCNSEPTDYYDSSTIQIFDSKTWQREKISLGFTPLLSLNHDNIFFLIRDTIDCISDSYFSNDNISVYNLSDKKISKIFDVPDTLYSHCDFFDTGIVSEIDHYMLDNKACYKITFFNKLGCEDRNGLRYYDYIFDEKGIIKVNCFNIEEFSGNKLNCQ